MLSSWIQGVRCSLNGDPVKRLFTDMDHEVGIGRHLKYLAAKGEREKGQDA
jgi:hypothetical protein